MTRKTLLLYLLVLVAPSVFFGQTKRLPSSAERSSVSCSEDTSACRSFHQLAEHKDSSIQEADWACFYQNDTPSNRDQDNPTTDEFFLLMDGNKSVMKNGNHPGMFVSVVKNGFPDNFGGYGPLKGGLGEQDAVMKAAAATDAPFIRTYDDMGDEMRFAEFHFTRLKWANGKFERTEEASLSDYRDVVIRKSTGRFVERRFAFGREFTVGPAYPNPGWENAKHTNRLEYNGRCFALSHAKKVNKLKASGSDGARHP